MNNNQVKEAMQVLIAALKEDKSEGSYYYSWQANIAMAFKDEYQRLNPHMMDGNKEILHRIANSAAKSFLDNLTFNSKNNEGDFKKALEKSLPEAKKDLCNNIPPSIDGCISK